MKKPVLLLFSVVLFTSVLISCGSKPAKTTEKKEAPSAEITLKDFFIAANDAEYSDNIEKIKDIKTGSSNKYRVYFVVEDSKLDATKLYTSFDNFTEAENTTERTISGQSEETEWFCWQNVYFEGYAGAATFYAYAEDAAGNKSKVVTYSITLDGEKSSVSGSDAK